VLEPAAFGAPVSFGPRHHAHRDAAVLMRRGGGKAVATVDETIETLLLWLGNRELRAKAGAAALAVVEGGVGAGERSYELVMDLVNRRKSPRGRARS
jgi:3-deoxy-D-manno-octulosonic-acid transferase